MALVLLIFLNFSLFDELEFGVQGCNRGCGDVGDKEIISLIFLSPYLQYPLISLELEPSQSRDDRISTSANASVILSEMFSSKSPYGNEG